NVRRRLRFRRRHILLGIFHFRGAQQRGPGKSWSKVLDHPDHDHLGHPRWPDRLGHGLDKLRRCAVPARGRRGRVLSAHRALLYLPYWFPSRHHARIVSSFLVGLPVSVAIGSPISTALLGLDGLFGLKGWQIMYIAEAIPTVAIGIATFFILTDKPEQAKFLTA